MQKKQSCNTDSCPGLYKEKLLPTFGFTFFTLAVLPLWAIRINNHLERYHTFGLHTIQVRCHWGRFYGVLIRRKSMKMYHVFQYYVCITGMPLMLSLTFLHNFRFDGLALVVVRFSAYVSVSLLMKLCCMNVVNRAS